jgi:hypothetical protein
MKELRRAMQQLKNGKAADSNGIVAEMLKFGGRRLQTTLLNLFNSVLQPDAPTPSSWKHTVIKVLHKSGDRQLPNNYRPIATIPILYKLFSRLLYNRLEPVLDKNQSCDQAGFRKGCCTTDHLFTTTILQEVADEWQIPLFVATVDFKKAFDSVTHEALWNAMAEQGVEPAYTSLLARLYQNQTAAVKTDCHSRPFNIERGVKQGDPLSPLLFNCVSESLMRELRHQWETKQWGVPLQPHISSTLTNLRFADDILLTSTSLTHITHMLADLQTRALTVGLQLHPDKTKILHNRFQHDDTKRLPRYVQANDMKIEVMTTSESTKYLGRALSFNDPHRTELENRIAAAWRKFYKLKQELTGTRYSLTDRLRLFHGTITPTVLYAAESWTLTTELENRLRRAQRQMLRMIIHAPRRRHVIEPQTTQPETTQCNTTTSMKSTITVCSSSDSAVDSTTPERQPSTPTDNIDDTELEPWADWIKRSTHEVEERMKRLKLDDWVSIQRQRKWKWAEKLALCKDPTWTTIALQWDPTVDPRLKARRRPGRPKTRWADDIYKFIHEDTATITTSTTSSTNISDKQLPPQSTSPTPLDNEVWLQRAKDKKFWDAHEKGYVQRLS